MPDPATLSTILQLCDSAFPTGAFGFSSGVEGLVAAGIVLDAGDLAALGRVAIDENLARLELPLARHAHRAAIAGDLPAILALDRLAGAHKPVPAAHAQSVRTGRRFLASSREVVTAPALADLAAAIDGGEAEGHHAVAFGCVLAAAGAGEETTAVALATTSLAGTMAAAVRLGVLGQTAAQRLVADLRPALLAAVSHSRALALDDLGAYHPLLDIAGLAQPALDGRLFAS